MKKILLSFGLVGLLATGQAAAGDDEILATLQKLNISKENIKIFPTTFLGMNIAMTNQGIFYVSNDGRFISQGPIFDMKSGSPKALTNNAVKMLVSTIKKDAISFKAPDEKYQVTVFTDIACTYCQKFHGQIGEYNKQGITVNYLAFPRQGVDSESGKQMQSIWSSVDKKTAFDNSYRDKAVPKISGMVSYVKHHYDIGRQIGITGTPTIVLDNGEVIGGYVPPEKLKEIVNHPH